jgi:hypothetical protein
MEVIMTFEELYKAAREGRVDDMPIVLDVPVAGKLADMERGPSYAAAANGSMPTITVGRRKKVPTRKWLAKLNGETA